MHMVAIHEAKTHLSRLLQECLRGETVVIAKGKTPVAKLVALPSAKSKRRIGGAEGLVTSIAEDFDAPLDDFQGYMP
ncbi:MAG: type II toxin-antitoxin system Phd/YefM family antitoxin [Verrucomicrobia bacterium]|jgi:antitoxin (DNA-binding transcriptional repressor) of toxin-antitoxin stability system|nr:type II toxin-antitoxin system Phd/YefM family antitoxin [Verrucomicrobiota bacterium]